MQLHSVAVVVVAVAECLQVVISAFIFRTYLLLMSEGLQSFG